MRGAGREDMVLHFECPATPQMLQDQLACKVKYVCIKRKIKTEINVEALIFIYITSKDYES
jgi:hypothetical protein